MLNWLHVGKHQFYVIFFRTTRDNPTPRVAYIPANLARVRGYHRQHDEPTEHLATSFTDNPVENQNSIIRSQENNRNSNVENVDDQTHGITNTNFNANS